MIERVRNWDVRLVHWANGIVGKPIVWGETDCQSIVRRAHVVMYGHDVFPKQFETRTDALRALADMELGDLVAPAQPVSRNFARTGDFGTLQIEEEFAMGMVIGDKAIGAVHGYPVTMLDLREIRDEAQFWRVG